MRANESLRADIEKSLHVQYILRDINDTTLVQVMIQVDKPPTDMAFDMSLRAGDDVWPLGPVAWGVGNIEWWAYDTDLPESIEKVDVVLTTSGSAAAQLQRTDTYHRLANIKEIWGGQPIVLKDIKVGSQEIGMCKIEPPSVDEGHREAIEQLDDSEPVFKQLKQDDDWAAALTRLEQKTREHPDDAMALYNLGYIKLANGDLGGAMKTFVEVQRLDPPAKLCQRTQQQLRRICEIYANKAEGDPAAMLALGAAYEHGWGVKQVIQNAKRYYRQAGNAGNAEAMCRLASMYEHETGAAVHTDKAHQWYQNECREWYRKAANLGNKEAKQWLAKHDQR